MRIRVFIGFLSLMLLGAIAASPASAACGNGVLESGEQCDLGAHNNQSGSCCKNNCTFRAAGFTCRPSAGACDVTETCTGASGTCPSDAFQPTTKTCRATAGACDLAERCTGASATCPQDSFTPAGIGCRALAGVCDLAESCTGTSGACPPDAFQPATVECRAATAICDLADRCTGASASCSPDAKSTAVCRPGVDACDAPERCDGVSDTCAPDGLYPATFVCRPATGVCDIAERCGGTSVACPPDAFAPATLACRTAADVCDLAEYCTGTSGACPSDRFQPAGVGCRVSTGVCDLTEQCTGGNASCPPNASQPDGTACDDADPCTLTDTCQAGTCIGSDPCDATVLTFAPLADTYVDSGAPTTSFGAGPALRADASPRRITYLRFAVSGASGAPIASARLRLGVSSGSAASGGTIHPITNVTWEESTLTYDTRPAVDGPALDTLGPVTTGTVVEFDLGGAVAGDGVYAFAIDTTSSDGITFHSAEASGAQPPVLILTLSGDVPPTVVITQPAGGSTFFAGDPVTLQGVATDDDGGDLSARLAWSSSLDGPLGTGAAVVASTLSAGQHTITASVTDLQGTPGMASTGITVVVPESPLVFFPVADTYVDDALPGSNFGAATEIKLDASPVRQSFLRFDVAGVPSRVRRAVLRLQAATSSAAASDAGGDVHAISDGAWSEQSMTFGTRPAIDGPVLASAGAVTPGAMVDFDVTATVSGNGLYTFALTSSSADGTTYQSRESATGRPELLVMLESAADDRPSVTIRAPVSGATFAFGQPVAFSGSATDPSDGDLSTTLQWASSIDGALGVGAAFSRTLSPGSHTITATAIDRDRRAGVATASILVQAPDMGFRDFSFGTNVETNGNRATSQKPESKLWYNDRLWWATLFNPTAGAHRIHRLDAARQVWVDTGVSVDERPHSRQDALWTGQKLYMVSRFGGAPAENRLLRYSYLPASRSYVLDSGFPVGISGGGTEAITLARDSTGTLWIAYTLNGQVLVNRTTGSDTQWGAPFVLPVVEGTSVAPDDIAAVVALPGRIGVFWSNQLTDTFYFAHHADGAAATDPAAWTLEAAARGGSVADDHMNLKVAADGRLFVAVKASEAIGLLVRSPAGLWSAVHPVTAVGFAPTRPQCLLDEVARRVYVFYSVHEAAIHYKTSSMDQIGFPGGSGTPLISSATTTGLNNPTTTKQSVDGTSGVAVVGSTSETRYYWHNLIFP